MRYVCVLVLAAMAAACESSVREQYCGTDSFYSISEEKEHLYRLDLKIGQVAPGVCRGFEWRERQRNLTVKVSSIEEAHRVIDRERARAKELIQSPSRQPLPLADH